MFWAEPPGVPPCQIRAQHFNIGLLFWWLRNREKESINEWRNGGKISLFFTTSRLRPLILLHGRNVSEGERLVTSSFPKIQATLAFWILFQTENKKRHPARWYDSIIPVVGAKLGFFENKYIYILKIIYLFSWSGYVFGFDLFFPVLAPQTPHNTNHHKRNKSNFLK